MPLTGHARGRLPTMACPQMSRAKNGQWPAIHSPRRCPPRAAGLLRSGARGPPDRACRASAASTLCEDTAQARETCNEACVFDPARPRGQVRSRSGLPEGRSRAIHAYSLSAPRARGGLIFDVIQ